jgi:pimeloyl-ACP methyl ester carboxylesterase
LATQATTNVTRIVEDVHQSVLGTIDKSGVKVPDPVRGVTSLVYNGIHNLTTLTGKGLDTLLAGLQPVFERIEKPGPETAQRQAALSALNGVMGDRLDAGKNPWTIPMTLHHRNTELDWRDMQSNAGARSKILLMVHGLGMNNLQWSAVRDGETLSHADVLGPELGFSPVYLRYNSGLHISQNGRELSVLLEQLVSQWPVQVDELTIVAHSMGGLVTRSAFHYARQDGRSWPGRVKNIVFLGTPHHGAPLERAGTWLEMVLGATPYSAPFTRLGRLRSAGVTDLRYGNLLDSDWHGHDRFAHKPDGRQHVPLPDGVACYAVAASTAENRSVLSDRLIGDGLVPLQSALGQHEDAARTLAFPKSSERIAFGMNHMQLLNSPDVTRQLLEWITPV